MCRAAPADQVTVVDIIPESLSGETSIDSEPNLGVNPADPSQIAASAFTPEPLGGNTAPIFISADGGMTWSCRSTIPIDRISDDITLRFGGLFNMLYVSALDDPQQNYQFELVICATGHLANKPLQSAAKRSGKGIDQPYVAAATINQKDRVFVGDNDWNGPSGRTATIDRSLDGAANQPASAFDIIPIEFKPAKRDSSEIRPAISADGKKVYAVFNRVNADNGSTRVADVILVRDDEGGNSAVPFSALNNQNGVPGVPVIKNRTFGWDMRLGQDRLGGDLAIAVDPSNADTVYLVWGELVGGKPTLHVIRSDDGGMNWSGNLRTVTNAKNPGLALNAKGTLAFLYQQVVTSDNGQKIWQTQLERTTDDFRTSVPPVTLAKFPVAELDPSQGQPQLGDYLHLMSVGDDFYGIFSSMNVPDDSRFPCKVIFQRKVDRAAKKLLDQDGNKVVPPSVDPFFVRVKD